MGLVKGVLRRPVSVTLIVLGIIVFGIASIFNLDMELIPDIQMPMMIINTVYVGADPDSVDELVTKEVEGAAESLSGVNSVTSYSYENYSMVMLQYDYNKNMNDAYTDLSAALDLLSLPDDAMDPIVMQMDFNAMPVATISVTNNGSSDMMAYINDTLEPELESLNEVAQVTVTGGEENYIRVQLDEQKLNQYGLTISTVASYIASADYNIPAGSISAGSQDISVSTSSSFGSLYDLKNTSLTTGNGSLITLGDVAEISFASQEPDSISRYNGEDNVTVSVSKNQTASTVRASNKVQGVLEELEATDPGVSFEVIYDSGDSIVSSLTSVAQTLIIGVILAMAVLFLFFGDWRASLIVAVSMPLSIMTALCFMFLLGFSLNIITTSSMIIAIGMIVDNSIVVLESCFRLRQTCDNYREAAIQGTGTVMMSIVASTITTVIVYIPLIMMNGMVGQMFGQLGFIIVCSLLASLISAITVVPLIYSRVKPKEREKNPMERAMDFLRKWYDVLLRKLLRWRKTTMLVFVVLLFASVLLVTTMDFELIPATYDGSITITSQFRSGTKLEVMEEDMAAIEQMVQDDENFDRYSLSISGNEATISAYAVDHCKRSSEEAVEEYLLALSDVTNMDIDVEASGGDSSSMTAFISDSLSVTLESSDVDDLREAVEQVQYVMEETPGVISVSSDAAAFQTSAHIVVDPLKAADVGLTPAAVAADVYYTLSGVTATTMEMDGEEYDIILNYPDGAYEDVNDLMSKTLSSQSGKTTTLGEIASIEYDEQPQQITRVDGKYQMTVSATATSDAQSSANSAINSAVNEMEFPGDVTTGTSFIGGMLSEVIGSLLAGILIGVFLVFLVMAMQFESPRFSIMVMLCIPFSLIGSFIILFLSGSTLNMVSMMGIMMLMGIVVNNGILLVDTINREKQHRSIEDALVEAGKIRMRPIFMTTLTTVLAMIPMIVGTDNAMMHGMSLVIVGGLIASTVLCLLMMPTFYLLISKDGRKLRKEQKQRKKEEKAKRITEDPLE